MAISVNIIKAELMREYYKYFSKYAKGKETDKKVAWVTAFTPVEILEALDIYYYYPESYAAVIAASGKEQELLEESERQFLSRDCCSYSCCIEGCVQTEEGPRGIPPKPDVLIATNNQCNTLPNWWNILAERYQVPLIVIDYPGENVDRETAYQYVTAQHKKLISQMELLSGNTLDMVSLEKILDNSEKSVAAWNKVIGYINRKQVNVTMLFDDISYLITARCKSKTSVLYEMMAEKYADFPNVEHEDVPIFWLGYPLWYHKDRYLSEDLSGYRIAGSNYITWWSLDYSGKDYMEKLFCAYNYTFLNLSQKTRTKKLKELIEDSNAVCTVTLRNKSCKCDFVSARDIGIPQAELEIDMIDRKFLDTDKAARVIDLLKDTVCIK